MKEYLYCSLFALLAPWRCAAGGVTTNAWGPVTNNVKMSIMIKPASEAVSMEDINVSALIHRLKRQSDPVSTFLWQRLSKEEQLQLMNYQPSPSTSNHAQDIIAQILNRIIEEPSFYQPDRFKGILLGSETKALMQQNASGSMLAHLNRLLLQDAYPLELSRNLKAGDTTITITEPVVLTIAFTNMSSHETFYVPTAHGIQNDDRYSFLVVTPSGKRISPHGDPMHVRAETFYALDPAKIRQFTFTFPLSEICKFDEIGTYTITASRVVDWPGGKKDYVSVVGDDGTNRIITVDPQFTVLSNPLTIKIVPDK